MARELVAVAVLLKDGRRVEAEAFERLTVRDDVERVVWRDGSWSFGKAWSFGTLYPEAMRLKVCAIGAGAYGQTRIWSHPEFRG